MKKLLLILCLLSISAHSMNIDYVDDGNYSNFCLKNFQLFGEIKPNDGNKIINTILNFRQKFKNQECYGTSMSIEIDSVGGDVDSALQLGRFFKKYKAGVSVSWTGTQLVKNKFRVDTTREGYCLSSCVFILAGGVERNVEAQYSKIGIHRPYFSDFDGNPSAEQVKIQRDKMLQKIRVYLDEMDINPQLADDMMSIPPNQIQYLTKNDLTRYRLNVADANNEESNIARLAHFHNISSAEYRRRDVIADQTCKVNTPLGIDWDCRTRILIGISQVELVKRREKSQRICSDNLTKDIKENCVKKIMVMGQ